MDLMFLANLFQDTKAGLIVALTPGWGAASCAALMSKNMQIPVLNVVHNELHQTYIEKNIDGCILRAMVTVGHTYHNDIVAGEVKAAFPNLLDLDARAAAAAADKDKDAASEGSDMERIDGEE